MTHGGWGSFYLEYCRLIGLDLLTSALIGWMGTAGSVGAESALLVVRQCEQRAIQEQHIRAGNAQ